MNEIIERCSTLKGKIEEIEQYRKHQDTQKVIDLVNESREELEEIEARIVHGPIGSKAVTRCGYCKRKGLVHTNADNIEELRKCIYCTVVTRIRIKDGIIDTEPLYY